jgi:glycine cleavage system H protein
MFRNEEENESALIPENEVCCIWMDAGVISYKICDRGLDCEHCPLDQALRGKEKVEHEAREPGPVSLFLDRMAGFNLDTRRFYHPGHTWVRVEGAGRVRVGLGPLVTTLMGSIDAVTVQHPGERVIRGASFGEITQAGHCFPLVSPLTGKVCEVNGKALSFPSTVTVDPLEEGWLMAVEPENLERDLASCRTGKAVLAWYLKGMGWLDSHVGPSLAGAVQRLGLTLYDGGEITGDLKDLIPPQQYRRMVLRLLGDVEEWLPEP